MGAPRLGEITRLDSDEAGLGSSLFDSKAETGPPLPHHYTFQAPHPCNHPRSTPQSTGPVALGQDTRIILYLLSQVGKLRCESSGVRGEAYLFRKMGSYGKDTPGAGRAQQSPWLHVPALDVWNCPLRAQLGKEEETNCRSSRCVCACCYRKQHGHLPISFAHVEEAGWLCVASHFSRKPPRSGYSHGYL